MRIRLIQLSNAHTSVLLEEPIVTHMLLEEVTVNTKESATSTKDYVVELQTAILIGTEHLILVHKIPGITNTIINAELSCTRKLVLEQILGRQ